MAAHQSRSRDPAAFRPAVGDFGARAEALWLATTLLPRQPTRGCHLAHEDFLTGVERLLIAAAGATCDDDTPRAARPRLGAVSFVHRFSSALTFLPSTAPLPKRESGWASMLGSQGLL